MSTESTHWAAFLEARLFGAPLSSYVGMPQSLLDSFGAHVERWEVVAVAGPLMLLAAVATHITARFALRAQRQVGQVVLEAGSQATQLASFMRLTPWIFPLGVIVGGLFFPIAILLYWLANSAWTTIQQHLVYRAMPGATPPAADASGAPVAGADHERSDHGTPQASASRRSRKATASRKRTSARKGGRH